MAVALLLTDGHLDRWFVRFDVHGRLITARSPFSAALFRNDGPNAALSAAYAALIADGQTVHICIIPLRPAGGTVLPYVAPNDDEEEHVVGDIVWTAATTRAGAIPADGAAVSRTTYAALFAAIGTTYGAGDGSTTFNVPHISGRVVIARETTATLITTAVSGFSGATLGATGGSQSHVLTIPEIPAHTHDVPFVLQTNQTGSGSLARTITGSTSSGSTGGGGAHRNVQPSIVLNAFVKV